MIWTFNLSKYGILINPIDYVMEARDEYVVLTNDNENIERSFYQWKYDKLNEFKELARKTSI
jgi:hypothetical protein